VDAWDITITLGAAITLVSGFLSTVAVVITIFWKTVGKIHGRLDLHEHKIKEAVDRMIGNQEQLRELQLGRSDSEVSLGKMLVRIENLMDEFADVRDDVKKHLQTHARESDR
jgi:hypothetical protein